MVTERVFLCNGAPTRGLGRRVRSDALNIYGRTPNVFFKLEELRRGLWRDIPPVVRDLLDVAAYVYAADQAFSRANGGKVIGSEIGAGWRRAFNFRVAVRCPDVWEAARPALVSALSFASEDTYAFEFTRLEKDTALDGFLNFNTTPFDGVIDEVVLFSGGLDSLAGAVQEAVLDRRRVLLVNHRPTEKISRRHAELVDRLERLAGRYSPLHCPVRVNKSKALGKEFTQRTRSFLFAALGAAFAHLTGRPRVRFYENGVVSLNLPPSAQVVGARASRTTHPGVLAGYQALLTTVLGEQLRIENPFLWETKTGVVERLVTGKCAELIGLSTSCGHTWARTKQHTHCGTCSQCIDRRFAVLAARQEAHDPADAYATDLLVGERKDHESRTMLAAYLNLAERVSQMSEADFFAAFGEINRVIPHLELTPAVAATRIYDLYRRHARQVNEVITRNIETYSDEIRRRVLPQTCLLRLVYAPSEGSAPTPQAEPTPRPESYFVRRGECWVVRFGGGKEKIYLPDRGFDYLWHLLGSPGRDRTAAALSAAVSMPSASKSLRAVSEEAVKAEGVQVGESPLSALADAVLDDEAIENLKTRLQEIPAEIEDWMRGDSPTRLEEIEELEKAAQFIKTLLRKSLKPDGDSRVLNDIRDRVRNRVCLAVKRALRKIQQHDPDLAAHLSRPSLLLGHTLRYSPPADLTWSLDE